MYFETKFHRKIILYKKSCDRNQIFFFNALKIKTRRTFFSVTYIIGDPLVKQVFDIVVFNPVNIALPV